ncbi:hypothetical protein F4774DRAFT_427440 [Daldinia eschscholtzii]|nr:hypothetical protein F4774DRAFT_427440 [Daldinia eschscholtzii]
MSRSATSSSPVSFQDLDDLTLELQPAPLRLPRRRTDPDLDGANSLKEEHTSMIGDDDSTPTLCRKSPSPPPQTARAKNLSQRRAPAPKLGSLVSKFEILNAVNNAEADLSSIAKSTAVPRVQRPLRHSRASESLQSIASDKHWTTANSSNDPPRRMNSPPLYSDGSKLPMRALSKKAPTEDIIDVGPGSRRVVKEDISIKGKERSLEKGVLPGRESNDANQYPESLEHSLVAKVTSSASDQLVAQKTLPASATISTRPLPVSGSPQKGSVSKSKSQTILMDSSPKYPQKGDKQSCHNVDQPVRGVHGSTASSKSPIKRTQISVADLRKSFEKNSQATGREQQMLDKSQLSLDISRDRIDKETIHSSGSGNRRSISSTRTPAQRDRTAIQPLLSRKVIDTRSENRLSEQPLPVPYIANTSEHITAIYQPESNTVRRIDNRNLDGAMSSEGEKAPDTESRLSELGVTTVSNAQTIGGNKTSRPSIIHSILANNSKASFHGIMTSKRPIADEGAASEPTKVQKPVSKPTSKPVSAARCTGKVSDLRRLFERSSPRESSPNSFRSFWQNRGRNKPAVATERTRIARQDVNMSSTSLATRTVLAKKSKLPELTTEILVDDFACDFSEP